MYIDAHAHLTDEVFTNNLKEIISNAKDNNVELIISCGYDINSSIKSLDIASDYNFIYSTFGIHPQEAPRVSEDLYAIIENYLKDNNKIIAIGEIGLDYHYGKDEKEFQIPCFIRQLEIAKKYNYPIVVHAREAVKESIDILHDFNLCGMFHCYSGNIEETKQLLDMGYYFGFDGPITFKKNDEIIKILKYIPIDRIITETDAPYLTPTPFRGKTNQPMYIKYIVEKIAEVKEIDVIDVSNQIKANTLTLFSKIQNLGK